MGVYIWSREDERRAPEGQIWVCSACGKRSRDRYGDHAVDYGWDESCFLNAALCYDSLPWKAVPGKDPHGSEKT